MNIREDCEEGTSGRPGHGTAMVAMSRHLCNLFLRPQLSDSLQ